ncbi:keratinocyte-associated protein 2-like [Heterodontus francisci]|uniref:keratinocyte-associated protein 2-like n=1 Tax=Heterodontus francisci TaxID=7792 RepID=UPI00355C4C0A
MCKRTVVSFLLSSSLSILIYSALEISKAKLALNNLENIMFGMGFEASFFPEVLSCFGLALYTAYQVHPVSCASCLVFSLVGLYFINNLSRKIHHMSESPDATKELKRRMKT